MGRPANFCIVSELEDRIVLEDLGPWDRHLTITNDAENVVEKLVSKLNGRRLLYYDSEGELTELIIKDGKFSTFAPGEEVKKEKNEYEQRLLEAFVELSIVSSNCSMNWVRQAASKGYNAIVESIKSDVEDHTDFFKESYDM